MAFQPPAAKLARVAGVIDFQDRAMASLRRRMARVEEANQDLIALARGHSGAAAAIHAAVLAGIEAPDRDALLHVVTQLWPDILGLDAVVLALVEAGEGMRADHAGLQPIEPTLVEQAAAGVGGVVLRAVPRGHALFGPACDLVRAEALIRLGETGLLALGHRDAAGFEPRPGAELLRFLGDALGRMLARWPR